MTAAGRKAMKRLSHPYRTRRKAPSSRMGARTNVIHSSSALRYMAGIMACS